MLPGGVVFDLLIIMKSTFCLLFTLLLFSSFKPREDDGYPDIPMKNGRFNYEYVMPVDSTLRSTLFFNARNWINERYVNPNAVISYSNSDSGILYLSGSFDVDYGVLAYTIYKFSYNLKILCKDNRYKVIMDNFYYRAKSSSEWTGKIPAENLYGSKIMKKRFIAVMTEMDNKNKSTLLSLHNAMKKTSSVDNDW